MIKPGSDDIVSDCIVFGLSLGARVQRAAINDNIAAARERIETEGRRWGRPRRTTWNQEAEVLERRAGGESVRAISTALKIPRATSAAAGPFQSRLTSRPCRR